MILDGTPAAGEQLKGLKVLLVGPSLDIMGGQAVQADLLLRRFRQDGAQVDFQAINPTPWRGLRWMTRVKYLRTLVVSMLYIPALLLRVPRYDIIHVFSAAYFSFILAPTPALLIGRLWARKTILNYRSGEADDHLRRSGALVKWIMRGADGIIVPSAYLVDVFGQHGLHASAISNMYDETSIGPRPRKAGAPVIIVARALEPLYDVETAIRAFATLRRKLPAARLIVLGEGSQATHLTQLAEELAGDAVEFPGRVERDEIGQWLDRADLFLNTSVIDNMPVSIIEALAAGLPVVSTDAGGIPWLIEDGANGCLTRCGDPDAAAEALLRVHQDEALRARLIAGGLATARSCTWEAVRAQWAMAYDDVAGAHE